MSNLSSEPRAKRPRVDKKGRFAALERLKQLKGNKHKCEVEEEVDSVYEIVDEREYVKKAKEKYGDDWIEDDGTGYAEDGRDFFEDEDYSDEGAQSSSKSQKKGAKKRGRDNEKPTKGKGSIRNLFSNAVPKKAAVAKLADDDILADILGELNETPKSGSQAATECHDQKIIAPAKIMTTSTRKSDAALTKEYINSFVNNIKIKEPEKKAEETSDDELLERIMKPKPSEAIKKVAKVPFKVVETNQPARLPPPSPKKLRKSVENPQPECEKSVSSDKRMEFPDDDMDFSALQDDENQFEQEYETEKGKEKEKEVAKPASPKTIEQVALSETDKLLNNWERICQMDNFEEEMSAATLTTTASNSDPAELSQENLKFWYWEAWEDPNKRPGEVFLFGRTAENKSICVRVDKIDRVLYLLPREYLLDPISKDPTRQKVTLADIYKELDEDIATELNLIGFRSRKVTKNFAYHIENKLYIKQNSMPLGRRPSIYVLRI